MSVFMETNLDLSNFALSLHNWSSWCRTNQMMYQNHGKWQRTTLPKIPSIVITAWLTSTKFGKYIAMSSHKHIQRMISFRVHTEQRSKYECNPCNPQRWETRTWQNCLLFIEISSSLDGNFNEIHYFKERVLTTLFTQRDTYIVAWLMPMESSISISKSF